jgi:DNA-binding transcriptional MerR regulator
MRIGELSRHTCVPARMLRYYEAQGLLRPGREQNGYRCYGSGMVELVQQIRGLLDAGLTTDIVRRILPVLEHPGQIAVHPDCLPETGALLREEAERIQRRIDCLARNRDAILGYLDAIRSLSASRTEV